MPSKRNDRRLIAWETHEQTDMPIEPAAIERAWMDESNARFAYRCLPMVHANQAGWIVRNPVRLRLRWNGGPLATDLGIRLPPGRTDKRVSSIFGHGIVTFGIPYLLRTPPGINLWVKGPANWIKDGIQPLEGVVETDWSESTFTMNWKLTRRNQTIRFDEGEPMCMVVPVPRGLAESLEPVRLPLAQNQELQARYRQWQTARVAFNEALLRFDEAAIRQGWQRDYMLGVDGAGTAFPEHQTKLALRKFRRDG
jgi:hypothetical protein